MKIAVVDCLPEGGAKRVVFQQCSYLSKNHELTYFGNTQNSFFDFASLPMQSHNCVWNAPNDSGMYRLAYDFWLRYTLPALHRELAARIDAGGFDVVLVHPSTYTQAPLLLSYLQTPSVYYMEESLRSAYEHSDTITNIFKRMHYQSRIQVLKQLDYVATSRASKLVCNSNYTAQQINKNYNRDARVVYPGVDCDFYTPAKQDNRSGYVLFDTKDSQHRTRFIRHLANKIKKKITCIRFSGDFSYSDAEIRSLLQPAKATLCLDFAEPFGLIALESMACGTPVIAWGDAGYAETVIHTRTGILLDADSSEERRLKQLTQAIQLFEEDKISIFAKDCHQRATDFTWVKHCQSIESELQAYDKKL